MTTLPRTRLPSLLSTSIARIVLGRRANSAPRHSPIVVHCHLSWDNVWQRPQQYLSRLAQWHPVLFVETEVRNDDFDAFYEYRPAAGCPAITQLKVIFPARVWSDGAYVDRERNRLVKTALLEPALRKYNRPIQWFYDPMATTAFLGELDESLVVYDCMDELSQFRGASPELVKREQLLLQHADLVFCGGSALHRAKQAFHDDCHFFGCGVDVQHFGKALKRDTLVPADIRDLPKPICGYYGVVDERLDYDLLLNLARSTMGSIVVIGPTAKVRPDELPEHPRLHWLGRREYIHLPLYAKGFDVCLMPFALNEATEFINPTKALEYLGAGRPVVSTAIADVVSLFGDVIKIATSHEEFITLCNTEAESPSRRAQRARIRRAEANTWSRLSTDMEEHIVRKEAERAGVGAAARGVLAVEPHSA
jgi:glycosyltransferase involved in cell wall biosynthesis